MGVFRAGITDRVELREGGEQRPAAREEGRAWRLGVRWRGGTASEMRLGDLRRLGAELGASSSPSADRDEGLGLPHSRHSREDQNCGFLERFGAGGGGSRGPTSPHRVSGTSPVGGAQEKHSQATQIRQNLHPHSLTSGLLTGHGRSPRPPAVPRLPEGRASVSYTLLISKGRINDFHTGKNAIPMRTSPDTQSFSDAPADSSQRAITMVKRHVLALYMFKADLTESTSIREGGKLYPLCKRSAATGSNPLLSNLPQDLAEAGEASQSEEPAASHQPRDASGRR